MKKILSISLLTLILLASSRLTISAHYCGGDLVSLEFFKTKKGCGKCGSAEKKNPCCKDVTSSVTSTDFTKKSLCFEFSQAIAVIPVFDISSELNLPEILLIVKNSVAANAPPYKKKVPGYILFRSFIV